MNLTGYFEGVGYITLHLHEVQEQVKLIHDDRSFKSGLSMGKWQKYTFQNERNVSYFDQASFDTNINTERYKVI